MTRKWYGFLARATLLGGVACDSATSTEQSAELASASLSAALVSAPVGYGELASSFVAADAAGFREDALWIAGGREASFARGAYMGGGLADEFVGGVTFGDDVDAGVAHGGGRGPGRGRGHAGPFGSALRCGGDAAAAFNAATQRVECPSQTLNGLTIARSAQYRTAAGAVQPAFDTLTTNSVNFQERVSGTVTYTRAAADTGRGRGRGGPGGWGHGRGSVGRLLGDTATILTATTTVSHQSDRTTTGLAAGSAARTTNGTSTGSESTTGTSSAGAFAARRTTADTTRGLVTPARAADATAPSHPTAGTVIRVMTATLAYTGRTPATLTRREQITYNGTATATVTITENGTTRSCTQPLPRGRLVCP